MPSRFTGPREPVTVETFVYIPMRDGTPLAADIYRPARPGKYPALLFRTPYGRGLPVLTERLRSLASHGYVVIANDARGCGDSGGVYDWYNYDGGPMDGYDCVEWAAKQPWCDSNVGMFGGSAPGVYCWHAAIQHPPHLKALFISTGAGTDAYLDQWYVGGIFQAKNRIYWLHLPKIGLPTFPLPGERAAEQRLDIYLQRMGEMERRVKAGKSPLNFDWLIQAREHENNGPYWRAKSAYPHLSKITIPVYQADHWGATHFITGTLRAFQQLKGPKKLAAFPIEFVDHAPVISLGIGSPATNRVDLEALQVRWFDYWLKGIQNGVMEEPPILIHTSGSDTWRQESEWPPKGTTYETWHLAPGPSGSADSLNDGLLVHQAGSAAAKASVPSLRGKQRVYPELQRTPAGAPKLRESTPLRAGRNPGVLASGQPHPATSRTVSEATYPHDPSHPILSPLDPTDRRPAEARSLTFTTPVLTRDLELTGAITLQLWAASSATGTDFIVYLTDVAPDGRSRPLTFGALKASHRTSHEKPTPVKPNQPYDFTIELWPISHCFKAGHRLRLSVAGSDYPTFEVNPQKSKTTVLHNVQHPSRVVLPVIWG